MASTYLPGVIQSMPEAEICLSTQQTFKRLSFRRKTVAFFVFLAMSVNGFAPSTMELGKFNFVLVLAAVTHNAVVTVLSKCRDSLTVMSNSLSSGVCGLLFDAKSTANPAGGKKEKDAKRSTAGDYAVVQLQKTSYKKRIGYLSGFAGIAADSKAEYGFINGFSFIDVKSRSSGFVILLLFLAFICAIRQRKGLSDTIVAGSTRKIKISA